MRGAGNTNSKGPSEAERLGTKRYCEQCEKYFRSPPTLQTHMNQGLHTKPEKREYPCPQPNCGTTWFFQARLRRHTISEHTNKKGQMKTASFPCAMCGKFLGTKQSLTRHKELHERPRVDRRCDICDLPCVTPSKLRRHEARAHNKYIETKDSSEQQNSTQVWCACARKFNTSRELRVHLDKDHDAPWDREKELMAQTTKENEVTGKEVLQNFHKLIFKAELSGAKEVARKLKTQKARTNCKTGEEKVESITGTVESILEEIARIRRG